MPTEQDSVAGFETVLESMAQLDFFSLLLPFILSYSVFYLALKQVNLFEEEDDDNKFATLVSVIGAFFVAQFIATNEWYQDFFVEYFGLLTIGLIGILGLFVLLAMIGWNGEGWTPSLAIIAILITGASFGMAGGFGEPREIPMIDLDLYSLMFETGLIWILVVGGVIWWLARDGGSNNGGGMDVGDFLKNGLGGSSGDK